MNKLTQIPMDVIPYKRRWRYRSVAMKNIISLWFKFKFLEELISMKLRASNIMETPMRVPSAYFL